MVNETVSRLAAYALQTGLIEESEYIWAINTSSWTTPTPGGC